MWYNDLRPDWRLANNRFALIMLDPNNEYAREMDENMKRRTIRKLKELHQGIKNNIPAKKVDQNLMLASWNIKNLGRIEQRTPESLFYIAEIINAFDIVAIQELHSNIEDFKKIVKILGSHWKYLFTDATLGSPGNDERFAFIYDSRRVKHSGLAGELVIPDEFVPDDNPILRQLKRTPTFTGFQSGWKKFTLSSVHFHPGDGTGGDEGPRDDAKREEEVRMLLKVFEEKRKEGSFEDKNMIILGDTNIYKNDRHIVERFTNDGFRECDSLIGKTTNKSGTEGYDRIFYNVDDYFHLVKNPDGTESGGVFDLFNFVYKDDVDEIRQYNEYMLAHKEDNSTLTSPEKFRTYYNRYWKVNQMSDHLPVWIEIQTDSSQNFLTNVLNRYD